MKIMKLLLLTIISFSLCQAAQLDKDEKLIVASMKGDLQVVQDILLDPSIKKNFINGALMLASSYGHESIVKLLIDHGANVNAFNKDLVTALIWASEKGYLNVVKLLVDKGARINARDKNMSTALIGASANGHKEVVKFLLDHDADVNCKNINRNTALDRALYFEHQKCVDLLNIYIKEYLPYKEKYYKELRIALPSTLSSEFIIKIISEYYSKEEPILKFSEFIMKERN